jgi:hypothetical protein
MRRKIPQHRQVVALTSTRPGLYGGARFAPISFNSKLAAITYEATDKRPRPIVHAPFIATTEVSIEKTCGDDCPFKNNGCWAQTGFTKFMVDKLDDAAIHVAPLAVIQNMVDKLDDAFGAGCVPQDGKCGGRDLRLMNFGDFVNTAGARLAAGAAARWLERGGGRVFGFTHAWRRIWPEAFGTISMVASVESVADVERARRRGYAVAIVVAKFPNRHKAFRLPGSSTTFVPCPGETETPTRPKRSCVECRLCMDADALFEKNITIAFEAHGPGASSAREALVSLRRGRDGGAC